MEILGQKTLFWFFGLNCGIQAPGSQIYHGISSVYGTGFYFADCWTKIPGTISGGFGAEPQFIITSGTADDDKPNYWHDEGWISHSGGLAMLLAELYKS